MTASTPTVEDVIAGLRALGSEDNRQGMARYGIATDRALGVSMTAMRPVARRLKRDQALSLALWETGIHEARLLAVLIGEPKKVTPEQMDAWAADFDSWDICDQACMKLFPETPYANEKIRNWVADEREFVRRAGFALMVGVTVRDKRAPDETFLPWFALIERHAHDPRNFVRKAVNWALRQIGKRSLSLREPALALAEKLATSDDATARWIGRDAVKELTDPAQIERITKRSKKSRSTV